jgi:hypothetical protein
MSKSNRRLKKSFWRSGTILLKPQVFPQIVGLMFEAGDLKLDESSGKGSKRVFEEGQSRLRPVQ